jgi:hypothetical protein
VVTADILTGILIFVTAIYAYLTHRMVVASEASVKALRDQSEAMLRPYITAAPFVRPHTTALYLRITNSGRTSAENLRLTIDRDFFQFGETGRSEKNLRIKSAFTTPIDSFAPGNQLIFGLGIGSMILGTGASPGATPLQFTITAAYDYFGKKVEEANRIDLRAYIGSEGERDPVVEELERIRVLIEKKVSVLG